MADQSGQDTGRGAINEASEVLVLRTWLGTTRSKASLAASTAVEIRRSTVAKLGAAVSEASAETASGTVEGTADAISGRDYGTSPKNLGILECSVSVKLQSQGGWRPYKGLGRNGTDSCSSAEKDEGTGDHFC
jgi:hypothetical protein